MPRGASFAGSSPPVLGRQRAAVDVAVGVYYVARNGKNAWREENALESVVMGRFRTGLLLVLALAVCAGGKSGGKRKRAGSGGGKTKMAGDAQGACSVSLHSASLVPLSSRICVVRPRTADGSRNQQGGGRARTQTCAVTEGSLEQLLKAGEREFSRNPVAAEDCYRRAVAADKTSVLALYNLGLSQMNQRRHDDAIGNFELVSIVLCASYHAILPCADSLRRARHCRFIPVMARRISDSAALCTTRRVPRLHQDKPADTRNCSREQSQRSSGRSS